MINVIKSIETNEKETAEACTNECKRSSEICKHCKENFIVSKELFTGIRQRDGDVITGYLVLDKKKRVLGILNMDTNYCEMSHVDKILKAEK